ncbi:MAG: hypothetical protein P0116_01410 [Candidatus Nitrosocosmicus sp.]|nr:hypothetical protein [Candidatus Nitrosocosmicus sp.]
MKFKFICEDSYEAEKLASIFTPQKDNSLFVSNIVKTIGNEVVVKSSKMVPIIALFSGMKLIHTNWDNFLRNFYRERGKLLIQIM